MALSAALLMLAACGGGSGSDDSSAAVAPTIPVSPAAPGPTPDDEISDREGDLRQTAAEVMQAYLDGDKAKFYTFLAADYRERCSFEEFLGVLLFAEAFIGDISEAEAIIGDIRFEGERAFVDIRIELNGVDLFGDDEEDEYPDYWILEDGKWKSAPDDPAPCELDFGDDEIDD